MENQIKMDARKSPSALFEIRKQIVRLHKKGIGPMAIKEQTGISWGAIRKAIDLFEAGGMGALKPMRRGCKKGEIYWSKNGNPRRKVFFDSGKGIPQQDIWLNYRDSINQNMVVTGYPTEKNLSMLENIVAASSNSGDLVLDAFCGSGTTMQAAYNLGRSWIGIDCEEAAVCSVLKRFNIGSEKMGDFVTDKAARHYKPHELLDERNFAQSLFGTCPSPEQ